MGTAMENTREGQGGARAERAEDVRLAVYHGFAATGRAPEGADLAASTGHSAAQVEEALNDLHASRDVVLEGGRIVMAHPFSSVPLGFSVMGSRTLWWGGCAWDSFAVPHLLQDEPDVLVATRCPFCDEPHAWKVGRDAPPSGEQVAHFLTPVQRIWDDVVHSCANQRLFCSDACVGGWLERTGETRGYTMDLATLWRLAQGWYAGRLERGYRRREPSAAASYFASAGLRGRFWGLPDGPLT
ncbi:organomercurial lyase [Actinomadura roseirufa]|uniref:organomercurial lyase n=1 Tax=Actinomadura roseirufa TaxID=2094049 RepID=UPI001A954BCC|nr:organomercurial lyase [Actinomadura roseirufa]